MTILAEDKSYNTPEEMLSDLIKARTSVDISVILRSSKKSIVPEITQARQAIANVILITTMGY